MGEPVGDPAAVPQQEQLAAPDARVAAVAGAVVDQPEQRLVEPAVLGGERGEVGVVVLHLVDGHGELGGEPVRPGPGGVAGVPVGHEQGRGAVVEAEQLVGDPLVRGAAGERGEVADMRRDEGAPVAGQGHGVLQLGPGGEDDGVAPRGGNRDGQGCVPARAADRHGPPGRQPREDRVLDRDGDVAVVDEEQVRDAGEALERVDLPGAQRLPASVARGHDEHRRRPRRPVRPFGEEEVVQRGVGQQDAELAEAGGGRARGHGDETGASGRTGSSTIGRAGEVSTAAAPPTSTHRRAVARSRAMTANGCSGRRLRSRRAATARSDAASQARW